MGLRENTNLKKKTENKVHEGQNQSYQAPHYNYDGEVELDSLERLKSNIFMLADLQQRLRFMNSEIESIIGTRKK